MTTLHAFRTTTAPLPPPPPAAGPRPALRPPASVLDLLCAAQPAMRSALDVDPARLEVLPPPRAAERPRAAVRSIAPALDEDAERRFERVRVLAYGGSALLLTALSAGALRLAL